MEHCPGFDFNIIESDRFITALKETYGDILKIVNVRYDPPYDMTIEILFDGIKGFVEWHIDEVSAKTIKNDYWSYSFRVYGITKSENDVTLDYIFNKIGEFVA